MAGGASAPPRARDPPRVPPRNRPDMDGEFTCPECGGSLWQVDEPDLLRFRCHVGHAYNAEVLLSEQGEALEAAGIREVMEETGLVIEKPQFAGITNDIFAATNKHYISIWMTAQWKSGMEAITEPDRYIEQRWCDFDSLPQPLFEPCWQNLFASDFLDAIKSRLDSTK